MTTSLFLHSESRYGRLNKSHYRERGQAGLLKRNLKINKGSVWTVDEQPKTIKSSVWEVEEVKKHQVINNRQKPVASVIPEENLSQSSKKEEENEDQSQSDNQSQPQSEDDQEEKHSQPEELDQSESEEEPMSSDQEEQLTEKEEPQSLPTEEVAPKEKIYIDPSELEGDNTVDADFFDEDEVALKRWGKVHDLFKPEVYNQVKKLLHPDVLKIFRREGPYKYRLSDLSSFNFEEQKLTEVPLKPIYGQHYIGLWNPESNVKEGRGIAVFKDGSIYEGFWKRSEMCGNGRIIYTSGDIYQGEWWNGISNGYGSYVKDGYYVKGWWKNGKLHGKGYETIAGKYTFRGEYKDGK